MWKIQNAQPAINQGARAGCHDAPACAGGFESIEQVATTGNLNGIGAVFFRDAAFDVVDICIGNINQPRVSFCSV